MLLSFKKLPYIILAKVLKWGAFFRDWENAVTDDQLNAWAAKISSEIVKREGAALALSVSDRDEPAIEADSSLDDCLRSVERCVPVPLLSVINVFRALAGPQSARRRLSFRSSQSSSGECRLNNSGIVTKTLQLNPDEGPQHDAHFEQ
jgi:hypothetical protein